MAWLDPYPERVRLLSPAMVVLAHPGPTSFNHAVADQVGRVLTDAGARVHRHDLYLEKFSALLTVDELDPSAPVTDPVVRAHREHLADTRCLVVVHPNWWSKPPAMLAGWLDRVLPRPAADAPGSTLGVRRLLVITSSDAAPMTPDTREPQPDPLDLLWRNAVAPALGGPEVERIVLPRMSSSTEEQRRRWLAGVARGAAWVSGAAR